MKKSFILLCAAALSAFSASAFTMAIPEITTVNPLNASAPLKAPASNMEELLGKYDCFCYDYTIESTPIMTFPIRIEAGELEDEIVIYGIAEVPLGLVGTVDWDNSLIMIENQTLRGKLEDDVEVRFQHGAWVEDENGNQLSGDTDLPMNSFIAEGGILIGYPNDIVQLMAYDANGEFIERLCAVSNIVCEPEYIDPYTYVPVGKATFHDGWLLPGFQKNPADYPAEVELERCVEIPGQFRMVNPYPYKYMEVNEGIEGDGYIVFDVTTPECVLALTGYKSGFYEKFTWGLGNFYFFNLEGLLLADYIAQGKEITAIEIRGMLYQSGYQVSDIKENTVTIRNCLFGYDSNTMAGGLWKIEGEAVEMTSTIILPEGALLGISDITIENAPAEYYNLQGIKVENPENGIYIRRQGNTAEKIYIK